MHLVTDLLLFEDELSCVLHSHIEMCMGQDELDQELFKKIHASLQEKFILSLIMRNFFHQNDNQQIMK